MECCRRACEKPVDVRSLSTCSRHGGAADERIATSINSEGSTLISTSPLSSLCLVTLTAVGAVVATAPKKKHFPTRSVAFVFFYTPHY